ncbi:hypothetical protein [Olleya sp. 1-3]|uniref:hypothetical protein n=1 Tax=Olleya sp. 1-3 TaxID=2058323 RepID=UPI0012FE91E5|nr:hypothetical protein [Olleya sp. 1-3]
MKNKVNIYLLVLSILNLLILLFFLELKESLIIVPFSFTLLYLFYLLKTSKKYKNEGLNILFILFYLAILFFPTFHFLSYKVNENNYYLSDYLKDAANHRLEIKKNDNQFSTLNFGIIKNILNYESDLTLNKSEFFKLKELNYLDSVRLSGETFKAISDSSYNYIKHQRLSGGGLPKPRQNTYLTIFKNNNKINLFYLKNQTIRKTLENYLNGYNSFYERTKNINKEIGFIDFWFASISSFKFSEIIPNTYLTKSLWIFQSIISFVLLFYISTNIPQLTIKKNSKKKKNDKQK